MSPLPVRLTESRSDFLVDASPSVDALAPCRREMKSPRPQATLAFSTGAGWGASALSAVKVISTGSWAASRRTKLLVLSSQRVGHQKKSSAAAEPKDAVTRLVSSCWARAAKLPLFKGLVEVSSSSKRSSAAAMEAVFDGAGRLAKLLRGGGADAGSICILAAASIRTSIGFWRGLGTG